METTVTLYWSPPQGTGPEAVVDNYTISISPAPLYQPARMVVTPGSNVTLEHNVDYSINFTAINCAGESDPLVLPNFQIGTVYNIQPIQ